MNITILQKGIVLNHSENSQTYILYASIIHLSRRYGYIDIFVTGDSYTIKDEGGIIFSKLVAALDSI